MLDHGGFGAVSSTVEKELMIHLEEEYKEKSIQDVVQINQNKITKIEFDDGRGVNTPLTIENPEDIRTIMNAINGYQIKKVEELRLSTGWTHSANFYSNEKKVMNIVFTNPMIINDVYYDVTKGKLLPEDIDKLLNSINKEWCISKP